MTFKDFSIHLQKLEGTTSRNDMILLLSDLFKEVTAKDFDKVMYLLQGRVAPLYVNLEFGMADRMVIKALVTAFGIDEKEITKEFKRIGDIGELAEQLNLKQKTKNLVLTILEVFGELEKIANTTGEGSVEKKN